MATMGGIEQVDKGGAFAMKKQRALIGFSAPIGYNYREQARKAPNDDDNSSPNPILYGSMGLFSLYDELWFACESLCPDSMRSLPYVKFLDKEKPGLHPDQQGMPTLQHEVPFNARVTLHDTFAGQRYAEGMAEYLGVKTIVDNHTRDLEFYDTFINGNLSPHRLAADLWLVNQFKELDFDIVLNPLTAKLAFTGDGTGSVDGQRDFSNLEWAERLLAVENLYDITGVDGPYHPCVDEIREDRLITDFRKWLRENTTRFDNMEVRDVERDVNARLKELTISVLDKCVQRSRLRDVPIKIVTDKVKGAAEAIDPLVSPIQKFIEHFRHNERVDEIRWQAFVAKTRTQLTYAD